jgi:mono/diheme cytochrome c family protein
MAERRESGRRRGQLADVDGGKGGTRLASNRVRRSRRMRRWLGATMTFLTFAAVGAFWTVPVSTRQQTAPAPSPAGSALFNTYCVACHGADARGSGPLASSLKKKPADLTQLARKNGGVFPAELVYQVIDGRNPVKGHGGGDMPVWGEALLKSQDGGSEDAVKDRIWSLVAYLAAVQVK